MLSTVAAWAPTSELLPLLCRMRKNRKRNLPPITPLMLLLEHWLLLPQVPWIHYPLTPTPWPFPRLLLCVVLTAGFEASEVHRCTLHHPVLISLISPTSPSKTAPIAHRFATTHCCERNLGFGNKRQYPLCFYTSPVYCYRCFSLLQLHLCPFLTVLGSPFPLPLLLYMFCLSKFILSTSPLHLDAGSHISAPGKIMEQVHNDRRFLQAWER